MGAAAGAGAATNPSSTSSGNAGQGQPGDFGNSRTMPTARGDAGMPVLQAPNCAGKTQNAQPVEVDMYIMLDRSGSMMEMTGAGNTKWDAIRQALTTFVRDPQSSGLGVGLQYFPIGKTGVPDTCNSDKECGSDGGPCLNKFCRPARFATTFTPTLCLSLADCPFSSPSCGTMGICEMDDTLACVNVGPNGCQGNNAGACVGIPGGCQNYSVCQAAEYAKPAVAIDLLPGNADPVTNSLMAEMAAGLTPTPVALQGALDLAQMHATAHPDHRVIAVLATDGLPTDCLPANVTTVDQAVMLTANIAAQSLAQATSIQTYVIGVFSPDDTGAMMNLDMMAVAGGTKHAYIVDSSKDVSQQLLDALATIRGGALECELELPTAPAGEKLDFNYVNVQFTDTSQHDLFYVRTPDQCTKSNLGWYYDIDPKAGTPTKILVCPSTCDTLQASRAASIEIKLGCATVAPL
jgi:hypothetical protein